MNESKLDIMIREAKQRVLNHKPEYKRAAEKTHGKQTGKFSLTFNHSRGLR